MIRILHVRLFSVVYITIAFVMCNGVIIKPNNDSELKTQMEREYQRFKALHFPDTPDMSVREYLMMKDTQKYILVDTREQSEQEISMIPGAITQQEFEKDSGSVRDNIIVSYCTIGARSGIYTDQLITSGFMAYNLAGSVLSWAHEGMAFVHNGKPVKRVDVYSKEWDYLPDGYEAVYSH